MTHAQASIASVPRPRQKAKPKSFDELVAEWSSLQPAYHAALKEQSVTEQAWFDDKNDTKKEAAADRAAAAAGKIEKKVVAIERKIIATPATSLAGLLQKIDIAMGFDTDSKDVVMCEIKKFLGTAPASGVLVAIAAELGRAWDERHKIEDALSKAESEEESGALSDRDDELSARIDSLERTISVVPAISLADAVVQLAYVHGELWYLSALDSKLEDELMNLLPPMRAALSAIERNIGLSAVDLGMSIYFPRSRTVEPEQPTPPSAEVDAIAAPIAAE